MNSYCRACGGPIALINPTPHIISLTRVWVHVTRFGRVKRRANHAPVVD